METIYYRNKYALRAITLTSRHYYEINITFQLKLLFKNQN